MLKLGRVALAGVVVGLLAVAQSSSAGVIFSDSFDAENGGVGVLNYNGFANWTVSDETVDLIGNGYFDFQPGNGLYVDMDGSTGNAGKMTSKTAFTFITGALYTLSFDLAGNHRNTAAEKVDVKVSLGNLVNQTYSLAKDAPFQRFSVTFVGNAAYSPGTLSFEGAGGDNIGMLLDNVTLSVPDGGATLSLLGLSLMAIGTLRRRR